VDFYGETSAAAGRRRRRRKRGSLFASLSPFFCPDRNGPVSLHNESIKVFDSSGGRRASGGENKRWVGWLAEDGEEEGAWLEVVQTVILTK
jgi:hypothetical protein